MDFAVVYTHGTNNDHVIISDVYAVEGNNFLIIDNNGKFKWVPMENCKMEGWDEAEEYPWEEEEEDSVG